MSETKDTKTTLEKINNFFKKEKINAEAKEVDPKEERVNTLLAFTKDREGEIKPEKFEDINLSDGTVLTVDPALEPGAAAVVVTEEGPVPLPVGTYTDVDGNEIIVTEPGMIDSVTPASGEGDEPATEDPNAQMGDGDVNESVKRLIERVEKVTEFEKETKEKFEALEKENKELRERVEFYEKEVDTIKEDVCEFKNVTGEAIEIALSKPTNQPKERAKNPLLFEKEEKPNIFNIKK